METQKDFHGMRTPVAGTQERLGRQERLHAAYILRLTLSRCSFLMLGILEPTSTKSTSQQQANVERDKSPCPPPVPIMSKRKRADAVAFRAKQQASRGEKSGPANAQNDASVIEDHDLASSDRGNEFLAFDSLISGPYAPIARPTCLEDSDPPRNPLRTSRKRDSSLLTPKPQLKDSPLPKSRPSASRMHATPKRKHNENSKWGRPYASQLSTSPRHPGEPLEPTDSPVRVPRMRFMSMLTLNQIANIPISASFRHAKDGYGQAQNAYVLWMQQVIVFNDLVSGKTKLNSFRLTH